MSQARIDHYTSINIVDGKPVEATCMLQLELFVMVSHCLFVCVYVLILETTLVTSEL